MANPMWLVHMFTSFQNEIVKKNKTKQTKKKHELAQLAKLPESQTDLELICLKKDTVMSHF